jgi:hypothetical protein
MGVVLFLFTRPTTWVHRSTTLGFEVTFPSDWRASSDARDANQSQEKFVARSVAANEASCSVSTVRNADWEGASPEDIATQIDDGYFTEKTKDLVSSLGTDATLRETTIITVGVLRGARTRAATTITLDRGASQRMEYDLFETGSPGTVWYILCITPDQNYDREAPVFDAIIRSFRILQTVPSSQR